MANKTYLAKTETLLNFSGSLAAAGSMSGSALCEGYGTIRGIFRSDVVSETGSGVRIEQSADGGENWDLISSSAIASACAASGFNINVVGNAAMFTWKNGAGAASAHLNLYLKPD